MSVPNDTTEQFAGTDRFEVVRCLGAGGMGVVYEIFDRERGERLALKTLLQVDAQAIYRFKREFRSLAEIVHPNLITLYELFAGENQWYFTMDLIEGGVSFLAYLGRPTLLNRIEGPAAPESAGSDASVSVDTLQIRTPDESVETKVQAPTPQDTEETRRQPWDVSSTPAGQSLPPPARLTPLDEAQLKKLRDILRQLVEGVAAIHRAGKLHRDLKPGNVMVRPDGRVVVLDFGLATETNLEAPPERGGGRSRSTMVSGSTSKTSDGVIVGTVAYMSPEQAAGHPLTEASDWYAVGVMLFAALTGSLPFRGRFWELVEQKLKLDAPAPLDLVPGIPADLNRLCVDLMRRDPAARPTVEEILARLGDGQPASVADETIIEEAPFVGRQRERQALMTGVEKLLAGTPVIFQVSGKSGAGKSSLIEHFLTDLSTRHSVVILSGRCYEQESVPYKAIDTVIDALTIFLMRLSAAEVLMLLPPHIGALARVFPVLNRVEAIARLAAGGEMATDLTELRRQAFTALRNLLARIGQRWPLIVQIDDLQWGDLDSANLLAEVLRPPHTPRLFLLVSYRSEDRESPALKRGLAALESARDISNHLDHCSIEPLTEEESLGLALELLGEAQPESRLLAERIAAESGGSPYLLYELGRYVRSGKALGAIQDLDLDEVLWQRVGQLPEEVRRLLEVIAVSGRPIPMQAAQQAARLDSLSSHTIATLRTQHLIRGAGLSLTDTIEAYHDRIRESIQSHLTADALKRHHASLAEVLASAPDTPPEVLATHYLGAERFEQAGAYFEQAAEQATRTLAFDRAEEFFRRAEELAPNAMIKGRIQEKRIHFYTDLARFEEAYEVGYHAVRHFGLSIPRRFVPPLFAIDLVRVRLALGRRKIPDLIDLPTMEDERLVMGARLIAAVGKVAYQLRPELCIWLMARLVRLCLRHGNSPDGAIGYVAFGGIFLGGILGRHRVGSEFGRLAQAVVQKYHNDKQRAEVHFLLGYFGTSWVRPAAEAEALWQIAYQAGLESGDLFHTGCAACATVLSQFMRGVPLEEVWRKSEGYLEFLQRVSLREPAGAVMAVRQAIRNLRGETDSPLSFETSDFREEEYVRRLGQYGSRHFAHYYFILKMQTLYLWGEDEKALEVAKLSAGYLKDSQGMLHSAEHHFWYGLILARLGQAGPLRRIHRRFRRWAANCPHNFLARERLLAAEIARLAGRNEEAMAAYAAAIEAAREYGQLPVEALACQQAAELNGRESIEYRQRALDCFERWGAKGLKRNERKGNFGD